MYIIGLATLIKLSTHNTQEYRCLFSNISNHIINIDKYK